MNKMNNWIVDVIPMQKEKQESVQVGLLMKRPKGIMRSDAQKCAQYLEKILRKGDVKVNISDLGDEKAICFKLFFSRKNPNLC